MKTILYTCFILCIVLAACSNKTSNNKEKQNSTDSIPKTDIIAPVTPDTLVFEWQSDMCDNTGYYLSKLYTEEEIKATYELMQKSDIGLTSHTSVYRPKDVEKIDIPKFTKEYEELNEFYNNCKPVDVAYWKNFIPEQKKRIEKFYYLKKIEMEAFSNPTVLAESKYTSDDCNKYAEAVASGDSDLLIETWREWATESAKIRQNPRYMEEFDEKINSADRYIYARVNLINFAWWNCMNQYVEYADHSEMHKEFGKLFVKTEMECDEP